MALSEINREAVNIHFQVRMTLFLSQTIRIKFCKSQYANWKTTCTIAVESTGEPTRCAGLNRM